MKNTLKEKANFKKAKYKRRGETAMKKNIATAMAAAILLSSCGTGNDNATTGGFLGAQLGSIIGSAIGGISGGPRGSDIGTLVGMAGGAVVGAAVGSAADKADQQKYNEYKANRQQQRQQQRQAADNAQNSGSGTTDSGFDPNNSGNDIIDFDGGNTNAATNATDSKDDAQPELAESNNKANAIEVRSVRFVGNGNGNSTTLHSGELAKVVVEVYNNSANNLYGVQPIVMETTGNKHIFVSAPIIIESIAPGKGIRYTAMIKADNKLKDGTAHFRVAASDKGGYNKSENVEFDLTTMR